MKKPSEVSGLTPAQKRVFQDIEAAEETMKGKELFNFVEKHIREIDERVTRSFCEALQMMLGRLGWVIKCESYPGWPIWDAKRRGGCIRFEIDRNGKKDLQGSFTRLEGIEFAVLD